MYIPINLKIVIRKDKAKEGLVPIYLQFIQNRKINRISLRKWIKPENWINQEGIYIEEKGKGAPKNAKLLNTFLRDQMIKGDQILLNAQQKNEGLSFNQFKTKFINLESQDFVAFCKDEIAQREKMNFAFETIRNYKTSLNKLTAFKKHISFSDLTVSFLQSYEAYMITELDNDVNTIFSAMKFVRTMLNEARKKGISDVYPFNIYKLVYKNDTRDRLDAFELLKLQEIYNQNSLIPNLQHVLRYFLFACYTGLTWRDLESLKFEEIFANEGEYFIRKKRKKTDNLFIVPLLQSAKDLIDLDQDEGLVFENIYTNQKSNEYIKKVVKIAEINKRVSFHVARHTFGTVAMNYGIPQEVVQKMMGHSKSDMTRNYAKVLENYVIKEMQKWNTKIVNKHFKDRLDENSLSQYEKVLFKIKSTRILKNLTIESIAEKVGISTKKYQEIEEGKTQLGLADMLLIFNALKLQSPLLSI
ncbi:MAG: tyrosine-type recombinase/integrase [Bacteroidetes bacterium]|jgi:integrase/DNA-binding XRE family transcriptional regulator|nr:tyrosine-type recombinase/integrase [Bacteroidota bacterium]MDF1867537.1 tyrosine-type recombinase/integrase [Saprospiraceae bacterium]